MPGRGISPTRFRGGGVKRRLRDIDFRRDKDGVPAKVAGIEYDPNRTANIALLHYRDGEKRYIVAPAEEIAALDLHGVQWSVLSGCETGVGETVAGLAHHLDIVRFE